MTTDERLGWVVRRMYEEAQLVEGPLGAADGLPLLYIHVEVEGNLYHMSICPPELEESDHQPDNDLAAARMVEEKVLVLKTLIANARAASVPTHMPKENL